MAMWPFRRKGWRKRSRTAPISADVDTQGRGRQGQPPNRTQTEPDPVMTGAGSTKERRENKLQRRRSRAYSFSPGRRDSLRIAPAQKQPTASFPAGSTPAVTGQFDGREGEVLNKGGASIPRAPTLHHDNSRNKRKSGQHLPGKQSSKRRKEDHDREAEIKAMSKFMPVRPATDSWTIGRPVKRQSIRGRNAFHRSWDEHPSSEVSLPVPESIDTAISSDSEQVSWKVSALDALAPRPTLRYSSHPLYGPASTSGPMRSTSMRKKLAERGPIPESTLKASKRIDDLANDLDASDIRELMERDKRRREMKKEKERERLERRLARRAEKQQREEAEAAKSGTPPPQNLERGVLGRELVTSGVDRTSAIITSSKMRPSYESSREQFKKLSSDEPIRREDAPSPLDNFYRTSSFPAEPSTQPDVAQHETGRKPDTEAPEPPSPRSTSPGLMNFMRSKKRRSSPTRSDFEKAESTPPQAIFLRAEDAESGGGRTSDSGSSRPWMSFFKWGGRNRRISGPSSFSNTSRDSMLANPPPQPPPSYVPRRVSGGMPKRTMSRFREDLPELPLSPPDSRVTSPEADPPPSEPLPIIPDDVQMRHDTPISGRRSQEGMRATPNYLHRDETQASPAPQSMSLASIDSEASWLSGRMGGGKRASTGLRNSSQTYPNRIASGGSESQSSGRTDDAIVDDEYLDSFAPDPLHRDSTGEAQSNRDEDDGREARWGAVGHTPTVMHHRETMRSREGLLIQSFDEEDQDADKASEDTFEEGVTPVEPQRATSVNLGRGHARNFSAGSAKLLNLTPRVSGENKRSTSTIEHLDHDGQ
ncbi:hypothetical protein DL765_005183 [Monosporascus sp. GIB2]|nr:hypothetical protein DL765_005183 [Monosporascus sp. GIB2]